MAAQVDYLEEGVKVKLGVTVGVKYKREKLVNLWAAQVTGSTRKPLAWCTWTHAYLETTPKPPFSIHLYPIMYLGPVHRTPGAEAEAKPEDSVRPQKTPKEVSKYFTADCRVQLGGHAFIEQWGELNYACVYIDEEQNTDQKLVSDIASICAVYPVIRKEKLTLRLVIGLMFNGHWDVFKRMSQEEPWKAIDNGDYVDGDRYYSRFATAKTIPEKCGRVYDITENKFNAICNWTTDRPRFAVYVCSGARLVVLDSYHLNINRYEKHSRSLVQPGGLVVVEHDLYLRSNDVDQPRRIRDEGIIGSLLVPRLGSGHIPANPVIFLGANESEYNSIAWALRIERKPNETSAEVMTTSNRAERAILNMPEGGYIVAIEDWDVGMQEVRARHRYERLYEPTVEKGGDPHLSPQFSFVAPEPDLLERILGAGQYQERGYDCIFACSLNQNRTDFYKQMVDNRDTNCCKHLPKQFNHRKCRQYFAITDPVHTEAYHPPVPPLYPAVAWDRVDQKIPYYWMPSTKTGLLLPLKDEEWKTRVISEYLKTDGRNQYEYHLEDQRSAYTLPVLDEYEMTRYQSPDQFNAVQAECDGVTTRFGVDGWLYQRTTAKRLIGKYECEYYKKR